MYTIVEVSKKADVRKFITFPDNLYKGCPQYVPALHCNEALMLNAVPILKNCLHKMWMVSDGKKTVGRICASINFRYNEIYGKKRARFGWFDCINDIEVAKLLLGTAESWAKSQGMTEIHGPLYYSSFGKQGMLVEGYENVPPFNCLYNYPYYNDLVTALGYEKELDWVQNKMVANHGVPEKTRRMARMIAEKYNLHFANLNQVKRNPQMLLKFLKVFNDSMSEVQNFIPLTEEEFYEAMKYSVKYLTDETSCVLMDDKDDFVAFGISFPSLSKALQKAKGRLFPFGWFYLLRARHNYETTDLLLNGAAKEWQNTGVSALFYKEMADKAIKVGNRWAIANPQIDTESAVNIWNDYEHELYMKRRCYIKKIA